MESQDLPHLDAYGGPTLLRDPQVPQSWPARRTPAREKSRLARTRGQSATPRETLCVPPRCASLVPRAPLRAPPPSGNAHLIEKGKKRSACPKGGGPYPAGCVLLADRAGPALLIAARLHHSLAWPPLLSASAGGFLRLKSLGKGRRTARYRGKALGGKAAEGPHQPCVGASSLGAGSRVPGGERGHLSSSAAMSPAGGTESRSVCHRTPTAP